MKSPRALLFPSLLVLVTLLVPSSLLAQSKMTPEEEAIYRQMMKNSGVDPDAGMQAAKSAESSRRWSEGKDGIVYYHIVGVYAGRANVVGGSKGVAYGDVTDRVEIDLAWKLADAKLVGLPAVRNTKSTVTNLRDYEPKCLPPILKGPYEHYDVLSVKQGLSGTVELKVVTVYPGAAVAQFCTASRASVAASRKERPEPLTILSPTMFEMKLPPSSAVQISADRKSLVQKGDGWTWTFTPTVKK